MWIMTLTGWQALPLPPCELPHHVPSLLEQMGITPNYNPIAAMAAYCNGAGRGVYFTYEPNGLNYQSRGAINPLRGMWKED
jgi:hypothetical protein